MSEYPGIPGILGIFLRCTRYKKGMYMYVGVSRDSWDTWDITKMHMLQEGFLLYVGVSQDSWDTHSLLGCRYMYMCHNMKDANVRISQDSCDSYLG